MSRLQRQLQEGWQSSSAQEIARAVSSLTEPEIKQILLDLQESEARLHLIANSSPALIAYIDQDHRYVYANRTFERWFNRDLGEIIGRPVLDLVGEQAYDVIRIYADRALAGETVEYETWMPYANGSRYVAASFIPHVDGARRVRGFFVTVHDLTQRKMAEDQVDAERAFTQSVLDSLNDEVCIVNAEGTIVFANKPWHQFWAENSGNPSKVNWIGVNYFAACSRGNAAVDEKAAEIVAGIRSVLRGEQARFMSEYPCHSETEQRWFRLFATPLTESDEIEDRKVVLVHTDITSRYLAEMKVQETNEKLRHEISVKNRFFSVLAHDLRSPFTTLMGGAKSLSENAPVMKAENVQRYARNIYRSGTRLFNLLEELLEWGRHQVADEPLQPECTNLRVSVEAAVGVVKEQAREKEVQIEIDIQVDTVFADPHALAAIFRNLLSNGVKFSEPGGTLRVRADYADEDTATIAVSDEGVGISSEVVDGVFDVGRATTSVGTQGERGTGLGLPLCHDLVVRSAGSIRFETEPGVGTTFYIVMPTKAG